MISQVSEKDATSCKTWLKFTIRRYDLVDAGNQIMVFQSCLPCTVSWFQFDKRSRYPAGYWEWQMSCYGSRMIQYYPGDGRMLRRLPCPLALRYFFLWWCCRHLSGVPGWRLQLLLIWGCKAEAFIQSYIVGFETYVNGKVRGTNSSGTISAVLIWSRSSWNIEIFQLWSPDFSCSYKHN